MDGLVREAALRALEDAELAWKDLDAIVIGKAPDALGRGRSGSQGAGGSFPVNMSGGALSSNPIGASGMIRCLEAANQVRGTAGDYQVEGAPVALGHAYGGAAQYFAMWIVSAEPAPAFRALAGRSGTMWKATRAGRESRTCSTPRRCRLAPIDPAAKGRAEGEGTWRESVP